MLDLKGSKEGFSLRRKERSFHTEGPKTEQAQNLEAEGIRSRSESTGGDEKLKVDTEYIKQFG